MKRNFIWDLDGTLFDSYNAIVDSLFEFYNEVCHVQVARDYIYQSCIDKSAREFINEMNEKYLLSFAGDKEKYQKISHSKLDQITLYKDAVKVLKAIVDNGDKNYVVTHRGDTTHYLLDKFGITKYFEEIITNKSGFLRKPNPDSGIYLVNKYHLDKEYTFYIGDRDMDMVFAKNCGIKGILFCSNTCNVDVKGNEDISIYSLSEILDLIK